MNFKDQDFQKLEDHLARWKLFSREEIAEFISHCTLMQLKKDEYVIQSGTTCETVVFVADGVLRSYFIDRKGEEVTYCFTFPDTFTTAYSSYITGRPAEESIQAISETRLICINKNTLRRLGDKSSSWLMFQKISAEQQYIELERRIFSLQKLDALMRYQQLLHEKPEYVKFIPLRYLSSYLGITQRHLSRIRRMV